MSLFIMIYDGNPNCEMGPTQATRRLSWAAGTYFKFLTFFLNVLFSLSFDLAFSLHSSIQHTFCQQPGFISPTCHAEVPSWTHSESAVHNKFRTKN